MALPTQAIDLSDSVEPEIAAPVEPEIPTEAAELQTAAKVVQPETAARVVQTETAAEAGGQSASSALEEKMTQCQAKENEALAKDS